MPMLSQRFRILAIFCAAILTAASVGYTDVPTSDTAPIALVAALPAAGSTVDPVPPGCTVECWVENEQKVDSQPIVVMGDTLSWTFWWNYDVVHGEACSAGGENPPPECYECEAAHVCADETVPIEHELIVWYEWCEQECSASEEAVAALVARLEGYAENLETDSLVQTLSSHPRLWLAFDEKAVVLTDCVGKELKRMRLEPSTFDLVATSTRVRSLKDGIR